MNVNQKLKECIKKWFFSEPLLFSVASRLTLIENKALSVPFRTGKRVMEFSSSSLENLEDDFIEALFKVEIYRVMLDHPYKRLPLNVKRGVLLLASDAVIWQLEKYDLSSIHEKLSLAGVEYLKQQVGPFATFPDMTFEQWYKYILDIVKKHSGGKSLGNDEGSFENAEGAALWEEDEEALETLKADIKKAEVNQGFGGLESNLQRELKSSCDFNFDYRKALTRFRQNIVSASRRLTRMRPSRRYDFDAMGSRYERKANVLIAVDVSGSITDESFEHFTHAIKNFFFLGIIEKIDLIFFDVNLKNTTPVTLRKKIEIEQIKGRGGTNFQPAIDYFLEHSSSYDGLILFTDGEGDIPSFNGKNNNVLWILDSRSAFEKHHGWIESLKGNKATYLPF